MGTNGETNTPDSTASGPTRPLSAAPAQPPPSRRDSHVRSKQRVADHGEVLTGEREVNAMLDLVKSETERIDSRFLEPACGDGNFLAEILRRKLRVVDGCYGRSPLDYERYAVIAVTSIYGIDILEDNVIECRRRLLAVFEASYASLFRAGCLAAVEFILIRNIIWGDALTLQTVGGVGGQPRPIIFSEWSPLDGGMFKRRDFAFRELLGFAGMRGEPLFSDLGEKQFFPEPLKEYPVTHYTRLADADKQ